MSRRKQKFPSHIASDDGDAIECQTDHLNLAEMTEEPLSSEDFEVNAELGAENSAHQQNPLHTNPSNFTFNPSEFKLSSSIIAGETNNSSSSDTEAYEMSCDSEDPAVEVALSEESSSVVTVDPSAIDIDLRSGNPNVVTINSHIIGDRDAVSPILTIVTSPFPPSPNSGCDSVCSINSNPASTMSCQSNCSESSAITTMYSTGAAPNVCHSLSIKIDKEESLQVSERRGILGSTSPILPSNTEEANLKYAFSNASNLVVVPPLTSIANSSANGVGNGLLEESKPSRGEVDDTSSGKHADPLICPVCGDFFKSKRSFNSHILVHCQLDNSPSISKRLTSSISPNWTSEKRKSSATEKNEMSSSSQPLEDESSVPLDLSCRRSHSSLDPSLPNAFECNGWPSTSPWSSSLLVAAANAAASAPETPFLSPIREDLSTSSDRCPLEDENENLVNEAREHEKAFFDNAQNELYLTEDSTGLEPPPPLPLVHSGGVTKRIKVCSDEGSPMVYRIKIHAEQIFVSRILGVNEETGDKIELYKCFMCSLSFPSVSRLQAHLSHHRQRFVCSKCNYSCDSRVQFSHHVQKEHLNKDYKRDGRLQSESMDDCNSAENTVTVAALLSALRERSLENRSPGIEPKKPYSEEMEDTKPQNSGRASPDANELGDGNDSNNGGDLFKMYTCRFCKKKFDRAFSCNRHERVHTGYKPCFCRICGRGFSEPRNLRHHVIRFHSDGSLRHLIKRDRRKRKEDDSPPSLSPVPPKDVLKENSNRVFGQTFSVGRTTEDYQQLPVNLGIKHNSDWTNFNDSSLQDDSISRCDNVNVYTTSLTKIFAASLDNSCRARKGEIPYSLSSKVLGSNRLLCENKSLPKPLQHDSLDVLEPGEVRFNLKTKIVEDDVGRRIIITDDPSDNSLDHSPQFSSYAPRLNIIQEPINRDKALMPITDDIGRTFYECPYCHKLFGSTSDLNRHLDFHEDLRPYNCEYCDYSARTNSQLKVHKMRHEGIKQFSCDICNYNGVTQSDLNRHKKTQSHISRSQNICTFCGLGFYSSSQKEVHIVQCHPEVEGASSLMQMSLGAPAPIAQVVLKTEECLPSPASSSPPLNNAFEAPISYSTLPVPVTYIESSSSH